MRQLEPNNIFLKLIIGIDYLEKYRDHGGTHRPSFFVRLQIA